MKKIILGLMVLIASLSATEIYATFDVKAEHSANLAFYSGGIVKKVYVDVSSIVKKGDNLVELENDDLKASLAMAQSALDNSKVTLKFAKRAYERQLLVKDLIDESKFDSYELAYEKAKVALSQSRANLAYKQTLLDKTIIHAPFDGVIFEKDVEVGDVVSGMMLRIILRVQSKTKRKIILEFDQKYHKYVKVGQTFKYGIDGDSKVYEGVIYKIHPFADSGNRKIKAEVKANKFIVGLFGEGYILVPDKKQ